MENIGLKNLTNEELLKLAESAESVQEFSKAKPSNDVVDFFNVFNFNSGSQLINLTVLFKIYKSWSTDPVVFEQFRSLVRVVSPGVGINIPIDLDKFKVKKEDWIYFLEKNNDNRLETTLKKNFDRFLKKYNIDKGEISTSLEDLDKLYTQFCRPKNRVLNRDNFKKFLQLYFKGKKTSKGIFFMISIKIEEHLENGKEKNKKTKN